MTTASIACSSFRGRSIVVAIDRISTLVGYVAGIAVLIIALVVTADVFLRYVFNAPTAWAAEISTYLMIGSAFLGAAYAYQHGAHIKVDIITQLLPLKVRDRLDEITTWLGFVFVAALAWQTYTAAATSYVSGAREFTLLMTPRYLPQIPIAIGMHLFALQMLADIARRHEERGAARLLAAVGVVIAATAALAAIGWADYGADFARVGLDSVVLAGAILLLVLLLSGAGAAAVVATAFASGAVAFHLAQGLSAGQFLAFFMLAVLVILLAGVHVSLGLGLIGLLGVYFVIPDPQPIVLGERAWSATNTFTLTAIPVFILMGELLARSGISDDLFAVLVRWIGRWPGGLGHAGIVACAMFAAVCGSSVATAATVGTVAGPEMLKRGYSPKLAYGSLAAGGTLGILIPPSIPILIYGATVGVSIASCFAAAIIPGIILTLAFMVVLAGWSMFDPRLAPKGPAFTWRERLHGLPAVVPVMTLILLVLGSIYMGVATPTEAASVGCLGALLICLARGRLTRSIFWDAVVSSTKINSFIFLILVGAAVSIYILDYLGIPAALTKAVTGLNVSPWVFMAILYLFYIVLGCFLDGVSILVMTVPVVYPAVIALGFDPIWFSIVLVILIELGLVTPPVGMNLYVLQGISGQPMREIILGVMPFVLAMLVVLALLSFFPELAMWLPSLKAK